MAEFGESAIFSLTLTCYLLALKKWNTKCRLRDAPKGTLVILYSAPVE